MDIIQSKFYDGEVSRERPRGSVSVEESNSLDSVVTESLAFSKLSKQEVFVFKA